MTESTVIPSGLSEVGHTHSDVSGAALRALVFGAMDGLVTNVALVAGVGAAGAAPRFIVLTDLAGLIAGAFSMAMGSTPRSAPRTSRSTVSGRRRPRKSRRTPRPRSMSSR
jgi:VIT1/CCC1 family predicted Fe2+/Mn2+ transporter